MTPEQKARVSIDALLVAAGWHVCNVADANIHASTSNTITVLKNARRLWRGTLLAGESVEWTPSSGWVKRSSGGLGQLLGDKSGVGTVFFDIQPDVFALTGGELQRQLGHDEILVEAFQGGAVGQI